MWILFATKLVVWPGSTNVRPRGSESEKGALRSSQTPNSKCKRQQKHRTVCQESTQIKLGSAKGRAYIPHDLGAISVDLAAPVCPTSEISLRRMQRHLVPTSIIRLALHLRGGRARFLYPTARSLKGTAVSPSHVAAPALLGDGSLGVWNLLSHSAPPGRPLSLELLSRRASRAHPGPTWAHLGRISLPLSPPMRGRAAAAGRAPA